MAIGAGSLIEIALNQRGYGGGMQFLNVYQYQVNSWPLSVTAAQAAEAWWNHVKTTYRACVPSILTDWFRTVRITELNNPVGDFAEWDVPVGEQAGTRATSTELMPPYVSVGVRLLVGTRSTRPGQKRIAPLVEADQNTGILQAPLRGLVVNLMNVMTADITLGAPAATTTLVPIVTRKNAAGTVTASQQIIGYLINNDVTTQNSRKFGRGS